MPLIKVELSQPAYERLVEEAVRQRRPIPWEAEVRLMRSLRVPLMPKPQARDQAATSASASGPERAA